MIVAVAFGSVVGCCTAQSPGMPVDLSYRLRYMSPEQARGRECDARTDVFSAAGVICELIANRHPAYFEGTDFAFLQYFVAARLGPPADLPVPISLALGRCFDRAPANRPSAADLRDQLIAGARMVDIEIGPHVIARRLVELGVPA